MRIYNKQRSTWEYAENSAYHLFMDPMKDAVVLAADNLTDYMFIKDLLDGIHMNSVSDIHKLLLEGKDSGKIK